MGIVWGFLFLYFGQGFQVLFNADCVLVLIWISGIRFVNFQTQLTYVLNQFLHLIIILFQVDFSFNLSEAQWVLFRFHFIKLHNLWMILEFAKHNRSRQYFLFVRVIIQTDWNFLITFTHRNLQVALWNTIVAGYAHEFCVFSWSAYNRVWRWYVHGLWGLVWLGVDVSITHFCYNLLCNRKPK